ncbi:ABC transporter ATP-binding protein [Halorubrum sp. Atlit-26R]|nr:MULTISPECIES: ABC transporter ATP-binding protein [Halorubrum]RLM63692.1 ABC transporter ATP-binding protein [Halorubrum sp. Atlit-26R]
MASDTDENAPQLRLQDVGKQYSDIWGVRDVSLDLSPGVLGLLGPNGAGKSTLMRLITTYLTPTEGRITFDGTDVVDDPNAVRKNVGYLPQDFGVYPDLTAKEFLGYLAAIRGLKRKEARDRIEDLLELTNLRDARDRRLGGFSGGMRQRVGIAQALLTDPDLLVVDEPTVGLDPAERVRFRNVLSSLGEDRVVILSTHIVSDVEATANEVAVLSAGRLRAHTTPEHLLEDVADRVWEVVSSQDEIHSLKSEYLTSTTTRRTDGVHARIVTDDPPRDATPVSPTLEEAYLDLLERTEEGESGDGL